MPFSKERSKLILTELANTQLVYANTGKLSGVGGHCID